MSDCVNYPDDDGSDRCSGSDWVTLAIGGKETGSCLRRDVSDGDGRRLPARNVRFPRSNYRINVLLGGRRLAVNDL